MQRKVSDSQKKRVAGRQRYRCAASISNYKCPLNGEPFDESGYEIDHIQELRDGGSNDISNLQALCPMCHRVKTSRKTSEIGVLSSRVEQTLVSEDHLPKCHHCHMVDQNLNRIDEKWFCQYHNPGSCKYLGCFGKDDVHALKVGELHQYRYVPGQVRTETHLPGGKIVYTITNSKR